MIAKLMEFEERHIANMPALDGSQRGPVQTPGGKQIEGGRVASTLDLPTGDD